MLVRIPVMEARIGISEGGEGYELAFSGNTSLFHGHMEIELDGQSEEGHANVVTRRESSRRIVEACGNSQINNLIRFQFPGFI